MKTVTKVHIAPTLPPVHLLEQGWLIRVFKFKAVSHLHPQLAVIGPGPQQDKLFEQTLKTKPHSQFLLALKVTGKTYF